MSVRRQISLAASAEKAATRANARISASPCAPSTRGSKIRRMRQSRGKFTHATTGGISVFDPLPASTAKPPRSNNATPTPERAPRSSRRASSRASSGNRTKPAKRRRDRQRELSSGAEPGVRGNGVRNDERSCQYRGQGFRRCGAQDVRPARAPRPKLQSLALREAECGSRTRRWRDQSIRTGGQDLRRDRENPDAVAPPP